MKVLLMLFLIKPVCNEYALGRGRKLFEHILRSTNDSTSETLTAPERKIFVISSLELILNYYWINKEGVRQNKDGPYAYLFKVFREKSGFTPVYRNPTPQSVGVRTNGIYDGEIGLVQQKLADITANGYYYTPDRYEFADFTVPFTSSPLCVVVCKSPMVPFITVLKLPYEVTVWITIFISILIASWAWYVSRGVNATGKYTNVQVATIFTDIACVTFSGACPGKAETLSQRLVLGSLLLFMLVLSNAFQGKLLGYLTTPPYLPEIQTLEQASRALKIFHTHTFVNDVFEREDAPPAFKIIRKKMQRYKHTEAMTIIKRVLKNPDEAVLFSPLRFHYFSTMREFVKNGQKTLHRVPECISEPGHGSFLVAKDSPIKNAFCEFVIRIVEAGLMRQWWKAQRHRMDANGLTVPDNDNARTADHKPLNLHQISGALELLAGGLLTAMLIFTLENLSKFISKFRRLCLNCSGIPKA